MVRFVALAALAAMAMATSASAIEMQTNYHYGENVGFPPMEVPASVYGGWGTRGWNPNAINRVPVQPGLPAMYPTGCNPGGGCNYCDNVWHGYQQKAFHKRINTRWYYGNHRPTPPGGPEPMIDSEGPTWDATPADVAPLETIEKGTTSVIRTQPTPSRMAPTPANSREPSTDDRPVPRTTKTSKPVFRWGKTS
jgi:hypothetical protein